MLPKLPTGFLKASTHPRRWLLICSYIVGLPVAAAGLLIASIYFQDGGRQSVFASEASKPLMLQSKKTLSSMNKKRQKTSRSADWVVVRIDTSHGYEYIESLSSLPEPRWWNREQQHGAVAAVAGDITI